jgi:hypothetical protein
MDIALCFRRFRIGSEKTVLLVDRCCGIPARRDMEDGER